MPTTENTVTLSPATLTRLRKAALQRGMKPDTYADELLTLSLVLLMPADESTTKPYKAGQFRAAAPTGRTAAEIDADINAMRDEWDRRDS